MALIYKIVPAALWRAAMEIGTFTGAPVDERDGYIHFSNASQVRETAARHFSGQADLLLIAVDEMRLGSALKWEVSRGGALFPHLYGVLPVDLAAFVQSLPLGRDGHHEFPEMMQ